MLARVLSAAVNGIEAFPVEVEVNCGWGDSMMVLIMSISPIVYAKGLQATRDRAKTI
jgi:hypothetical protein